MRFCERKRGKLDVQFIDNPSHPCFIIQKMSMAHEASAYLHAVVIRSSKRSPFREASL